MALTDEQRERVYWLLEGHMDDPALEDDEGELFDAEYERRFAAFETSEELFLFAYHASGDLSPGEWRRVVDSPLCDRGTAHVVFWRNSPVHWYDPDAADPAADGYALVRDIERRTRDGLFPDRGLSFDPAQFRGSSLLAGRPAGAVERVPELMRRPSPGEPVAPLW